MLDYLLITIISFLGLIIGTLLIFMASEEQKPGKKYFILIQNITFTLIIASLLFFYNLHKVLIIILSVIVYLLLIFMKNKKRTHALYPLIGLFFYIVLNNKTFLIIIASLTFIYGLTTAFLQINVKDKKSILKLILSHSTFLLTALLPFLISYF